MKDNLKMREKLILEVNNLLGELMDDEGISDENLRKIIHLKADFENEILGNVKVYAPFMDFPDPELKECPRRY
jgi:hypothetical protein